jgi:cytochrome c
MERAHPLQAGYNLFVTNTGTSPNNGKLTKDFEQAVRQGQAIIGRTRALLPKQAGVSFGVPRLRGKGW